MNYFTAPATLLKSETKLNGNRINVVVLASDESYDRDNDKVLSEAFTEELRQLFLQYGIFDYDHVTIRGGTDIERGTALIGTPTSFNEERIHGSPVQVIEGYLHVGNPYVDNSLGPALLSKSDRIAVSIGGSITGYVDNKKGGKDIHKISMNHLAFCPRFKAINLNTSVTLSKGKDGKEIQEYSSTNALLKSMEAGFQTDSLKITGGQAIQPQSLEGGVADNTIIPGKEYNLFSETLKRKLNSKKIKEIGNAIVNEIISGEINNTATAIEKRAIMHGLGYDKAKEIADLISRKLKNKIDGLIGRYRLIN